MIQENICGALKRVNMRSTGFRFVTLEQDIMRIWRMHNLEVRSIHCKTLKSGDVFWGIYAWKIGKEKEK